jgi:hypothetical protein
MDRIDHLARATAAAGLDDPRTFERFVALGPQERRLLEFLEARQAAPSTPEVREGAGISNVSQAAINLNAKLSAMDDPRQVLCLRRQVPDREGRPIQLGFWHLMAAAAANDPRA